MKTIAGLCLVTSIAALQADGPRNLALSERGCRAFSNGDADRYPAQAAIDGNVSTLWASSLNGHIDGTQPAIWGVEFPQLVSINKVVLRSPSSAHWQLTDFRIEYEDAAGAFRAVEPLNGTWANPVVGELRNRPTYLFTPVVTKKLRLVITGCGANHVPLPWGQKNGQAEILEFEAFDADLDLERLNLLGLKQAMHKIRVRARTWKPHPFKDREAGQSANAKWLRSEKLRAGYALGMDHFQKYAAELQRAGLNTIINHYWRGLDPDDDPAYPESSVAAFDGLLKPLGMRQFLWTALYFYPEDLPHPLDRGTPYRRTVDCFGVESRHAPCPLDEKMWDRFTRIAHRVAALARRYPTVQGFQFDWELYAADSGTSCGSFAYNNQQCFCDHCFNLFLAKIGVKVTADDVPREERFRQLAQAKVLSKYYAALGEEVYKRGVALRKILHAANPDLILGWYGTNSVLPFAGLADLEEIFAGQSGYAPTTWFGYAMARAFGTSRLPMVFLPNTITDTRPDSAFRWVEKGEGWWTGAKSLAEQTKIDRQRGLHVLWVDGIIPLPELGAEGLERAARWTTTRGNGFWINELYRLTAPLENPEWMDGAYKSIISDFWQALRRGTEVPSWASHGSRQEEER